MTTDALFETPAVGAAPVAPAAGQTPAAARALDAAAGNNAGPVDPGKPATPVAAVATGPVHKVVGVDLSLTATGVADRHGATVITSSGHRDDTLLQRRERLGCIRRAVLDWTDSADLVVLEAPSYGSKGGSAHDRAGLWWLVVSALMHRGIRVVEVAPSTRAKYATGNGRADKDAVLTAAVRRLAIHVSNNNAADAAWLCAIGHDLLGDPLLELPATHRAALVTVRARMGDLA